MHKRTIRLAISAIMLALVVSVPVDAAGQERAELRQRQQQQRERPSRARPDQRRAVPRDYDRRDSAPRDYDRRGSFRRGFGQRGFGQLGFGRRGGFRSRFNFNFQLGTPQYYTPQYYPPYNGGCGRWDEPSYTVVFRGGRWVRQYFCVNMSRRNRY